MHPPPTLRAALNRGGVAAWGGVAGGFARLDPPNLGSQGSVAGVARAPRVLHTGLSRVSRGRPLSSLRVRMHMRGRVCAPPVCVVVGGWGGGRSGARVDLLICHSRSPIFILSQSPISNSSLMVFHFNCYSLLFISISQFFFMFCTVFFFILLRLGLEQDRP